MTQADSSVLRCAPPKAEKHEGKEERVRRIRASWLLRNLKAGTLPGPLSSLQGHDSAVDPAFDEAE